MRLKTTPLMKGAMIAVRDCMGVKKEEKSGGNYRHR